MPTVDPSAQGQDVRYVHTNDGVRIAYSVSGDGPPLVFVRGWISHLQILWRDPAYRAFCNGLASGLRLIRYDCRGNGLSDWYVPRITLAALVSDQEAVADDIALGPMVLYGAAFGGPVAALFAARHPDRVSHLVLDGTYARGSAITSRTRQLVIRSMFKTFPEAVFLLLGYATNPESGASSYRDPDTVRLMISPHVAADLYALAFATDISTALRSVTIPTLVLHRAGSHSIPVQLGREVAGLIPGARFVELDGSAHNPWEGDAHKTLATVAEFLGLSLRMPVEQFGIDAGHERYTLQEEIGAGAGGTVHRALDNRLQRSVAIKVIRSTDERTLERFRREATIAARISHPGICAVYDTGERDGAPFIVMELLDGRTLADELSHGPVPLALGLDWACQLADTLAWAELQNVLHRDLKPSNIFITRDGHVKLLDFGIAKVWQDPAMAVTHTTLTDAGVPMGTWAYMSPEQVRGEPLDHRSDLFSFGVVLYELSTGRNPFIGRTLAETVDRILHLELPPENLTAHVPEGVARPIVRALAKERRLRYATIAEMRLDLRRAAN
jgi:pimeloyl-ACP methyl ester carboxylesterase